MKHFPCISITLKILISFKEEVKIFSELLLLEFDTNILCDVYNFTFRKIPLKKKFERVEKKNRCTQTKTHTNEHSHPIDLGLDVVMCVAKARKDRFLP